MLPSSTNFPTFVIEHHQLTFTTPVVFNISYYVKVFYYRLEHIGYQLINFYFLCRIKMDGFYVRQTCGETPFHYGSCCLPFYVSPSVLSVHCGGYVDFISQRVGWGGRWAATVDRVTATSLTFGGVEKAKLFLSHPRHCAKVSKRKCNVKTGASRSFAYPAICTRFLIPPFSTRDNTIPAFVCEMRGGGGENGTELPVFLLHRHQVLCKRGYHRSQWRGRLSSCLCRPGYFCFTLTISPWHDGIYGWGTQGGLVKTFHPPLSPASRHRQPTKADRNILLSSYTHSLRTPPPPTLPPQISFYLTRSLLLKRTTFPVEK